MIHRSKITLSFCYIKNIILFLSIFITQVKADTKIIAKNGDTLFKLSKQYNIPLKELMHKNNFNHATRIVEGEVIIIPLRVDNKYSNIQPLTYIVKDGDTLYKIGRSYKVNIKDILSINNLNNSSILKINQKILIPNKTIDRNSVNQQNTSLASRKVFFHQTSKTEKISSIAIIHSVSTKEIITFNNLNGQEKIDPNTKLRIRKNKPLKWLTYGSLSIDWSDWSYLDGNYLTQAKNKKNKSFYIAINCKRRTLNNTLNNSFWTEWYFPKSDFEFKLIADFCDRGIEI